MPVYTTVLLEVVSGGRSERMVDVPAGRHWIVRDIAVYQTGSTKGVFYVTVAGGAVIFKHDFAGGGDDYEHWEGRQAVAAGGTIVIGSATAYQCRITGYDFSV